jgi:tripartite-type tricarboxylate transporter receptor subunit TctC
MRLPRRQFLRLASGAAALTAAALPPRARAQNYPSRPIKLVVPFPPGGAFDALARPWVEKMKPRLGTVIVENIGGGGASLGAAAVARAHPDGYTLLLGGTLPHVNEALLKRVPLYDPVKDLDPILALAASSFCIPVHPAVPAATLAEFVAYANQNRGKLSYGHSGIGSLNHLIGERFKLLAGMPELLAVPYRGAGVSLNDLVGAQVPMIVAALTAQVVELHRTGKLRVLAVTSAARLAAAPELPTTAEAGFGGLIAAMSLGLLAPAGTPPPIVAQIAAASRTALAEPAYQALLIAGAFEPIVDSDPEKFRASLSADVALWAPVVASLGLKID